MRFLEDHFLGYTIFPYQNALGIHRVTGAQIYYEVPEERPSNTHTDDQVAQKFSGNGADPTRAQTPPSSSHYPLCSLLVFEGTNPQTNVREKSFKKGSKRLRNAIQKSPKSLEKVKNALGTR